MLSKLRGRSDRLGDAQSRRYEITRTYLRLGPNWTQSRSRGHLEILLYGPKMRRPVGKLLKRLCIR